MSDWFDAAGNGTAVDLHEVLDASFLELATDVVGAGALLAVGVSRDGGAVGVTVTLDGRWRREWFRSGEDLREWMSAAVAAVSGASREPATSGPGRGSAGRKRA